MTTTYTRDGNIGGILSKRDANGNDYYFRYDGSGNVVGLTDSNQNSVAEYSYDAWGNTLSSSGTQASSNLYRYSTKELQPQTGLYNYGLRFYSAGMGRWINRDPLQEAGGLNLYAAFGNSPANGGDPYGLSFTSFLGGFAKGFVIGGIMGFAIAAAIAATGGIGAAIILGVSLGVSAYGLMQAVNALMSGNLCPDARDALIGEMIGGLIGGILGGGGGTRFVAGLRGAKPVAGLTLCFVAGTLVAMADGSHKPIEQLKAGDKVLARSDKSPTAKVEAKKVKQTFVHYVKKTLLLTLKDGSQVETTSGHRFWVDGHGWQKAKTFGIGTSIVTRAGPSTPIAKIEEKLHAKPVAVYNFEVEDDHTYFVGSSELWAHNAGFGEGTRLTDGYVYRGSGSNPGNLAPRLKDVNGISTSLQPPQGEYQRLSVQELNKAGIAVIQDGPNHVSLVPVDAEGNPSQALLQGWQNAKVNGQAAEHPATQALKGAIECG